MPSLAPQAHLMSQSRYVFILRIWLEEETDRLPQTLRLRGSLQQLGQERIRYFHSLDQILDLVSQGMKGKDDPGQSFEPGS